MRKNNDIGRRLWVLSAVIGAVLFSGSGDWVRAGTVQLGAAPPNLTVAVAPNIVLTFDDSGSMQSSRVNDNPPWTTDNSGNQLSGVPDWGNGGNNTSTSGVSGGPWRCANVIDADNLLPSVGLRAKVMNGVYYNPNITYNPPLGANGKLIKGDTDGSKSNADATLKAVWVDGIAVNRPLNPATVSSTAYYNDNPDLDRAYDANGNNVSNAGALTNLMGTATFTNVTTTYVTFGTTANCPAGAVSCTQRNSGSRSGYYYYSYSGTNVNTDNSGNYEVDSATDLQVSNSTNLGTRVYGDPTNTRNSPTATYITWSTTAPAATNDNRWQCGSGPAISGGGGNLWNAPSPMDGQKHTLSDGTTVTYPNGGPHYYRLIKTVSVPLNQFGQPTYDPTCSTANCDGLRTLYNVANWEAVPVPSSQYQNFANWYAYYRTRNQMARTALSRVFGDSSLSKTVTNGYGGNQRVAWQNLDSSTYQLPSSTIISELIDTSACTSGASASPSTTAQLSGTSTTTPPACYRSAFYNWIFQVPASGGTPTRSAVTRAGTFFTRGNGKTGITGDLHDPYWQPPVTGTFNATTNPGNELYCRQNYHMLVTDGLWNGGNDGPQYTNLTLPSGKITLPDGVTFPDPTTSGVTSIYNPVHDGGNSGYASLSDIAFHYWATNLRTDLYSTATTPPQGMGIVPAYLPDQTTSVFNLTNTVASNVASTKVNPEIYFNPNNDPATWPHMDEFLVGLGVNGQLNLSQNTNCTSSDPAQQDACLLRKGSTNSAGIIGWPTPNGSGQGIAANVDDTWHAALAGRGQFYSAGNPQQLISALTSFLANITARAGSSVALTTSNPVATASTASFVGGYNIDWSGNLLEYAISPSTGQTISPAVLDAGCVLTGTATTPCPTVTTQSSYTQNPTPANRNIYTYGTTSTPTQSLTSAGFTSLNTWSQCVLNAGTWNGSTCAGGDGYGPKRIDWLRGDRTNEASGSTPQFRTRTSLLGAIVDSQPLYVGSPTGGFTDSWPAGSPEAATTAQTYSQFIAAQNGRIPIIYAAANDGMVHAFSVGQVAISSTGAVTPPAAVTGGVEQWAYVPQTVIQNGAVNAYTNSGSTGNLVPTVDGGMTEQDVFFSDGKWHTILVGALRYGGRGIYAVDITNPTSPKVLWEFSNNSTGGANLGYTFSTPNIARLRYSDGTNAGKWVVLVPNGYMPPSAPSSDPATTTESLFVLDAEKGTVIKEIITDSTGVNAYGLTTPAVWSFGGQVDDIAVAGDLMGNLWRFDLRDASSSNWTFVKMFQTPIPSGSGTSRTSPAQQPITVMPNVFSDTANGGNPIWIFGTGKYLAPVDNTSVGPTQSYYGIRDYGSSSSNYPIDPTKLVAQTLSDVSGTRYLTQNGVMSGNSLAPGWYFNMVANGERDVAVGSPLYSSGLVILSSLIPSNNNPCQPGLTGSVMVVSASTGGAPSTKAVTISGSSGSTNNGAPAVGVSNLPNAPTSGSGISPVMPLGGGKILIPGLPGFSVFDSFWHRRSWSELLQGQ